MYVTTKRKILLFLRETGLLAAMEAAEFVPKNSRQWLAWLEKWDEYAQQTTSRKNGATEKVLDYFTAYYAEYGGATLIKIPSETQESSSQKRSQSILKTSGKARKRGFGGISYKC